MYNSKISQTVRYVKNTKYSQHPLIRLPIIRTFANSNGFLIPFLLNPFKIHPIIRTFAISNNFFGPIINGCLLYVLLQQYNILILSFTVCFLLLKVPTKVKHRVLDRDATLIKYINLKKKSCFGKQKSCLDGIPFEKTVMRLRFSFNTKSEVEQNQFLLDFFESQKFISKSTTHFIDGEKVCTACWMFSYGVTRSR